MDQGLNTAGPLDGIAALGGLPLPQGYNGGMGGNISGHVPSTVTNVPNGAGSFRRRLELDISDLIDVVCGKVKGTYVISRQRVLYGGIDISPTEFERLGGRASTKKWKQSIRILHKDGTAGVCVGDWLVDNGYEQPKVQSDGPPEIVIKQWGGLGGAHGAAAGAAGGGLLSPLGGLLPAGSGQVLGPPGGAALQGPYRQIASNLGGGGGGMMGGQGGSGGPQVIQLGPPPQQQQGPGPQFSALMPNCAPMGMAQQQGAGGMVGFSQPQVFIGSNGQLQFLGGQMYPGMPQAPVTAPAILQSHAPQASPSLQSLSQGLSMGGMGGMGGMQMSAPGGQVRSLAQLQQQGQAQMSQAHMNQILSYSQLAQAQAQAQPGPQYYQGQSQATSGSGGHAPLPLMMPGGAPHGAIPHQILTQLGPMGGGGGPQWSYQTISGPSGQGSAFTPGSMSAPV